MTDFVTKDSGKRQEFSSGAVRDTVEGKPRYSLIPVAALRRWADLMARGAEKYGERNWELGMPTSRYLDSGMRHLFSYLEGDRTEDHLAAVLFNVGAMIHFENTEWDDLNETDPFDDFIDAIERGEYDDLLDSDDANLVDATSTEQLSMDLGFASPEQNDSLINHEKVKQDAEKDYSQGPGSPWGEG